MSFSFSSRNAVMVAWRAFRSSLSGAGAVETDSRAAARLAYETNRLESKGFEERSEAAWSCSRRRISKIQFLVAGGFAVGPVPDDNYNGLIRMKGKNGTGSSYSQDVARIGIDTRVNMHGHCEGSSSLVKELLCIGGAPQASDRGRTKPRLRQTRRLSAIQSRPRALDGRFRQQVPPHPESPKGTLQRERADGKNCG